MSSHVFTLIYYCLVSNIKWREGYTRIADRHGFDGGRLREDGLRFYPGKPFSRNTTGRGRYPVPRTRNAIFRVLPVSIHPIHIECFV